MNLKLKRTPGIYLVGFMGSGKTTVGRLLADKLGWPFVDLDDVIEAAEGERISDIFAGRGEEEFRRVETEAIRKQLHSIECGRPAVVALGGGAFARERNRALLRDNGISIWLDCPLERVRARIAAETHRPLARDAERFERLYEERLASYAQADFAVRVDCDDPAETVAAILGLPVFR